MQIVTLRPTGTNDIRARSNGADAGRKLSGRAGRESAAVSGAAYRSTLEEIAFVDAALDDPEPGLAELSSQADIYYVHFPDGPEDALAVLDEHAKPDLVHVIAADVSPVLSSMAVSSSGEERRFGAPHCRPATRANGSVPALVRFLNAVHGALARYGRLRVSRRLLPPQRAAS